MVYVISIIDKAVNSFIDMKTCSVRPIYIQQRLFGEMEMARFELDVSSVHTV